ncbi:neprilysin-1 [Drosophila ficusphila]|uniref:neprilysin-1 n=1 Tax=Drosophila ficusphila TaxID=30025 RepID=UPI0007E83094|nr:neprilysin-1 [Drosophila ficusphila]
MEVRHPASVCIILVALALGSLALQGGHFKELTTPLGQQIMRLAKSAEMRSFMKPDADPCRDFYSYACGNFPSINKHTSDVSDLLLAGYLRRVGQLLKEPRMSTDRPMEVRVKYFYESCLDTAALRQNRRAHVMRILREFGGMPAVDGKSWDSVGFDAVGMMAQLLRRYGKLPLVGVYVAPDFANAQINRLYIGQRRDFKHVLFGLGSDITHRKSLQSLLGLSEDDAHLTAFEAFSLELDLSESAVDPRKEEDPRLHNRLTLLANMTDAHGPVLNLTRFVSTWLGHEYHLPVYESVPSYLVQVENLLLQTPNRILANYMLASLLADFEIEADESYQEQICAARITDLFPDVVDHMVYHSLEQQSPHFANELGRLWLELKASFEEVLRSEELHWLDEATRGQLLEKLQTMAFEIAGGQPEDFEQRYGDLVVSSADYYGNMQRLLEVRAANLRKALVQESWKPSYYNDGIVHVPLYLPEANKVVLPASFMQHRYFWDDVYPSALKYGSLGLFLAHEMGHGFDDRNRLFDAKGSLRENWPPAAKTGFDQAKRCLADQINRIRFEEGGYRTSPSHDSQAEEIADNLGIRIAQAAFSRWRKEQPDADGQDAESQDAERLPHLSLSPEQLFFLGAAQTACTNWQLAYQTRVYPMMANLPAFAAAFQCSNSSRMNPSVRCQVY